MKLGKREVEALTCPPGRADCLVFDDELPGFSVRVTQAGTKVFVFQYRRGNKVRRLRLGVFGEITPAHARRLAEVARGEVQAGRDPVAMRNSEIEAEEAASRARRAQREADGLTLDKLITEWERKQLVHRSANYRREGPAALRRSLTPLLAIPAHAIDAKTLRRALDKLGSDGRPEPVEMPKKRGKGASPRPAKPAPTMARRVKAYGSALYGWAVSRELVPENPFARIRLEGREAPRERYLTDAELGEVWREAGRMGWPWDAYFRFLLLTLQRVSETAAMRWVELAPGFETWELPGARTKNGKPHLVHLAEPARAILAALPRVAGADLVFTTTGKTPISGFSHAKARLEAGMAEERAKQAAEARAEPAAIVPWRLHDFRRTGVTVLARLGTRWEVADRVLNHVQGAIQGVAAVYQRHEFYEEREAAMQLWAAHVLKVAAVAAPGEAEA
ncbi:MAG: site-specific integrase [Alphaproteobacteria bacterium]|nr:site-specific integrase [Alphaproteobacteria bacterium]